MANSETESLQGTLGKEYNVMAKPVVPLKPIQGKAPLKPAPLSQKPKAVQPLAPVRPLAPAPKPQSRAVSTNVKSTGAVSAKRLASMQEMAGAGVSTRQEDNLIPMIVLLQALSPICDGNNPAHIEGAEAGNFWFKESVSEIGDGEEGFDCQMVYNDLKWVEWIPRKKGGGLVQIHGMECPEDAEREEDEDNPQKVRYMRPNGNEVIETRYIMCRVLNREGSAPLYLIPLTSTGHTFAKKWTTKMNQNIMQGGKVEPCFSRIYHITSQYKQKGSNAWYTWNLDADLGYVSDQDFEIGKQLYLSFNSGSRKVSEEQFAAMQDGTEGSPAPVEDTAADDEGAEM